MKISSINKAWEKLFDKYNILKCIEAQGFFNISAEQIKEFQEPRLMTEFDHKNNLPKLFKDNELAILPVTIGDYVISHFSAYHNFEEFNAPVTRMSLPSHIQILDVNNISNEAIALNCAFISGIISDFMEDDCIFSTLSGRMKSGNFSFNICNVNSNNVIPLNINNSQIEIDAAYEGNSSFALFKAKMDISEDFIIRQLYYPFRACKNRMTKPVRPVFLIYSNGIYRLFEYTFEDFNNYNSLRLVKQKNYSIEDTVISYDDIRSVLDSVSITSEPEISFIGADSFERVINLCEILKTQDLSRADVTQAYDFNERQTNYYTDAARYLGLLDKKNENRKISYSLTETGRKILNLNFRQRQLAYCERILSHKVFNDLLRICFKNGVMPSLNEIMEVMKQSDLYHVESDKTFFRRASTIKGWLNWIISLINNE